MKTKPYKPNYRRENAHRLLGALSSDKGGDVSSSEESSSPSPFSYQKDFAKMHAIKPDHPLAQFKEPRALLKALLLEVIKNRPTLITKVEKEKIKAVKYITAAEYSFLIKVEAKMGRLGNPLHIAEMCAIKLYTDNDALQLDLIAAQNSGNFDKWVVWDRLLMSAMLKLHLQELAKKSKYNHWLYGWFEGMHFTSEMQDHPGFFKSYTSTSRIQSVAFNFALSGKKNIIMAFPPYMHRCFINCDVSWISKYSHEEEILFARSAVTPSYPAYQCLFFISQKKSPIQYVYCKPLFSDRFIVPKGTTKELPLPADGDMHVFDCIKIEENATLTIIPWQKEQQNGGKLYIRCRDCILGKNAKITVSARGCGGGTAQHPTGYGLRGGTSGRYCAAGGSHTTAGGNGRCQDAFKRTTYDAISKMPYEQMIITKETMICGSGGGYIRYPHTNFREKGLSSGAEGAPGGGSLYLEIDGHLRLGENTAFLASGGDATSLTGGAGSGGSICLSIKKSIIFTSDKACLCAKAEGGSNQKALHPLAQGAGGNGQIVFFFDQIPAYLDNRLLTTPLALCFPGEASQWEIYKKVLCRRILPNTLHLLPPIELLILTYLLGMVKRLTKEAPCIERNTFFLQKTTPHHVSVAGKYYNAQGVEETKKRQYQLATLYHKAALALQEKCKNAFYAEKADTLMYLSKIACSQGSHIKAFQDGKAVLAIRQQLYVQKKLALSPIIAARNHLGWISYQQGLPRQALQQLEDTLCLWEKHHGHTKHPVLIYTYNYIGLVLQSLGQYPKAIQKYHKKALDIASTSSGIACSAKAITFYYIAQAQTHMRQYPQAIASHHEEMRLLEEIYGKKTAHPDKARSLCGEALAYFKSGNRDLARQKYQLALAQLKKACGEKAHHPDIDALIGSIALSDGI